MDVHCAVLRCLNGALGYAPSCWLHALLYVTLFLKDYSSWKH